jgi:small subunit ribosomal protein S20e
MSSKNSDLKINTKNSGKVRIILTSKKVSPIERICESILKESKIKKFRVRGPIRIPTKKLCFSTRKSPCGEGTNTWDKFEINIHKRVIDIFSDGNALKEITSINIDPGINVEVHLLESSKK